MKVAMMIANEMAVSHAEEIKHLSKEALRREIELIVEKEWASSDPEKLVSDVEQEIQENLEKEENSELNRIMAGTYVIKPAPLSERSFEEWCQDIIDIRKKYKEECFSEKSRYEYRIPKPRFRPTRIHTPFPFYKLTYDWNDDDKPGSEA